MCPSVSPSVSPSVVRSSVRPYFRFRMITSECQWIFTKLGLCIEIVKISFWITNGRTLSVFDRVIFPRQVCIFFRFRTITWVNINRFSPNSVCALILYISGSDLLITKFHQFLKELSARDMSIFSFSDDNSSKLQWIFTKLGMRIANVYRNLVRDC